MHKEDWKQNWRKPDRGVMVVVGGPSGVGKSTMARMLVERLPYVVRSVSTTSREREDGEQDGVDYHYVDGPTFEDKIARGLMLEYVQLFGHYYGTERRGVERLLTHGTSVVMQLNTQGMERVHRDNPMDVVSVFLLPPSYDVLRERIVRRNREKTPSAVDERMADARREMAHRNRYDRVIINNALETAYHELESVVVAELAKRHRRSQMLREMK